MTFERRDGESLFKFLNKQTCGSEACRIVASADGRRIITGLVCQICGEPLSGRRLTLKSRTCGKPECARLPGYFAHVERVEAKKARSKFRGYIPLTNGRRALVDPDDHDRIIEHLWRAQRASGSTEHVPWYAMTTIDRKVVSMHALVLGIEDGRLIDHASRNGLDNRRVNLREATHSQNAMNRKRQSNNTSGFKGVTWNKQTERWQVMIQVDRKLERIGFFDTPEDAALAYDAAARIRFGEFARLNFPEPGEQAA